MLQVASFFYCYLSKGTLFYKAWEGAVIPLATFSLSRISWSLIILVCIVPESTCPVWTCWRGSSTYENLVPLLTREQVTCEKSQVVTHWSPVSTSQATRFYWLKTRTHQTTHWMSSVQVRIRDSTNSYNVWSQKHTNNWGVVWHD